jgi:hypothetical protein
MHDTAADQYPIFVSERPDVVDAIAAPTGAQTVRPATEVINRSRSPTTDRYR